MENEKIQAIVREKFDSISAFALAIGWVPQKVYKMFHKGYVPKIGEAVVISKALDITLDELASFFA